MAMTWLCHSLPRVRLGPAQTGPTRAHQSPVRTQSVLTVDWSMLTVDLAPHVSDTGTLDPHVPRKGSEGLKGPCLVLLIE